MHSFINQRKVLFWPEAMSCETLLELVETSFIGLLRTNN